MKRTKYMQLIENNYKYGTSAIYNQRATRMFTTCNTWLLVSGTDLFSLRLSSKKNDNQHNSHPMWRIKITPIFFVRVEKIYFRGCCRILVISLFMPWDGKGWKSLW